MTDKSCELSTINNEEKSIMLKKIEKDTKSDSMYLCLNDKRISHSVELLRDTIILDIAEDSVVVGIELCDVSTWLSDAVEPGPGPEPQEIGELVYMTSA